MTKLSEFEIDEMKRIAEIIENPDKPEPSPEPSEAGNFRVMLDELSKLSEPTDLTLFTQAIGNHIILHKIEYSEENYKKFNKGEITPDNATYFDIVLKEGDIKTIFSDIATQPIAYGLVMALEDGVCYNSDIIFDFLCADREYKKIMKDAKLDAEAADHEYKVRMAEIQDNHAAALKEHEMKWGKMFQTGIDAFVEQESNKILRLSGVGVNEE
jgi:hypothetical protein